MASRSPEKLSWPGHLGLLRDAQRIRLLDLQDKTSRTRAALFGLALLLGTILGGLLVHVPLLHLMLGIGGLAFAFLLLFKIEVAVIVALLLRDWLGQYNYLGGETPMHPNGVLGVAIIGGALFFFLFNRIDFSRLPALKAYTAFFVVCLLSLMLTGEHFAYGLTVTLRLATALAIYAVLVYRLDTIKQVKWVIAVTVGAQIWPVISGLLRIVRGAGGMLSDSGFARLGNSGRGVYYAMIVTLCLVHFLNAKTKSGRLLWGSLSGLFGAGLFFSYGRGGWIGFVVALIVIGLLRHRKLLMILPVLLVLAVVLVPTIPARFADIDLDNLTDRDSSTLAHRYELWQASIEVYKTHPLFGVGYGADRYRVGEYLGQYPWMIHNDYLSVLLGTGLVGFVLFIIWHGQWLVELLKVYRGTRYEYDKMMALAVLAVFIASLVFRISDNMLLPTDKLYGLSALVAVILALPSIRADEEARKSDLVVSKGHLHD